MDKISISLLLLFLMVLIAYSCHGIKSEKVKSKEFGEVYGAFVLSEVEKYDNAPLTYFLKSKKHTFKLESTNQSFFFRNVPAGNYNLEVIDTIRYYYQDSRTARFVRVPSKDYTYKTIEVFNICVKDHQVSIVPIIFSDHRSEDNPVQITWEPKLYLIEKWKVNSKIEGLVDLETLRKKYPPSKYYTGVADSLNVDIILNPYHLEQGTRKNKEKIRVQASSLGQFKIDVLPGVYDVRALVYSKKMDSLIRSSKKTDRIACRFLSYKVMNVLCIPDSVAQVNLDLFDTDLVKITTDIPIPKQILWTPKNN